jgi:hypothetical protein
MGELSEVESAFKTACAAATAGVLQSERRLHMNRRNMIVASVTAVAGAITSPLSGASATVKLRAVAKRDGDKWATCRMSQLKKGDSFRVDDDRYFEALENPTLGPDGVWSIYAERDIRAAEDHVRFGTRVYFGDTFHGGTGTIVGVRWDESGKPRRHYRVQIRCDDDGQIHEEWLSNCIKHWDASVDNEWVSES